MGGRSGRDILKIVGNTVRRQVGDEIWAERLMEEIDRLGHGGVVIIDDLRWPGEYLQCVSRDAFKVRLVTSQRMAPPNYFTSDVGDAVDGLLTNNEFDAEVPAKGLVTQEMLEKLIGDLWRDRIRPKVTGEIRR